MPSPFVRLRSVLVGCCALATTLLVGACVDNRNSVFIRGVVPAEADAASGGCSVDAANDNLLLGGAVDPGIASGYTLDLSVANQLITRANSQRFQAETNRIVFQRAEVRISSASAVRLDRFSTLVTGLVDPSSDGTSPGVGVVSINVLQPALLEQLLAQGGNTEVVAFVKLFGETIGGTDVETDFFQFPITVTAPGGLVVFPAPENGVIDCQTQQTGSQGTCRVGQNGTIPCSACFPNEYCTPR